MTVDGYTHTDLEGMLSKADTDKDNLLNISYMWNLKNKKAKLIGKEIRLMVIREEGRGEELEEGLKVQTSYYDLSKY